MKCENLATHRFTWPGQDEQTICSEHKSKLEMISHAMGIYIQIIPLTEKEKEALPICNQK